MYRLITLTPLLLLLAFGTSVAFAQTELPIPPPFLETEPEDEEPPPPTSIELLELAKAADLIVVAQVDIVDYDYRRTLPVEGTAYLRPIITYKKAGELSLVRVFEEGLGEQKCYFSSSFFGENARYLLFLQRDPERNRFRGHPVECALPILVREDGGYAVQWPLDHIAENPALTAAVEPMTFVGPGSRIPMDELDYRIRDRWVENGWARVEERQILPTHGIALSSLRKLFQAALDEDPDDVDSDPDSTDSKDSVVADQESPATN